MYAAANRYKPIKTLGTMKNNKLFKSIVYRVTSSIGASIKITINEINGCKQIMEMYSYKAAEFFM